MNIIMMITSRHIGIIAMAACIGGSAGYLGSLMVSKRTALMAGALGHLTLPGVSLGMLYGFDVSIGALIFLAIGVVLIWLLEQFTELPLEALTAVVFASSLAVAFLFLPERQAYTALIGNISQVPLSAIIISIFTSIVIFVTVHRFMPQFILSNISKDLAILEGYNVAKISLIYLVCIALIVALGVRIVGGLMTAALVSIPACASNNISSNLRNYSFVSLVIGMLASITGVVISILTDMPIGPTVIITSSFIFVITLFIRK